ncbi:MAG: ABC transporter substrate-binding protein, partial [Synergistaceae bacterium]|nr:ABC transporter substrate-binding protein [Synergistaceae bacterium]
PNTCLFLMTFTDERKPLFKWVGPLAPTKVGVLALKSKGLKITSASDLANLKAGVVRDDIGDELAKQAGIQQIERVPSNDQNIKKLTEGRIDIWVFEESVAKWQIQSLGFNADDYESVWTLSESDLYYAFHKDTDDALIASIQKTLDDMKADGSYEAVMKKYNMR